MLFFINTTTNKTISQIPPKNKKTKVTIINSVDKSTIINEINSFWNGLGYMYINEAISNKKNIKKPLIEFIKQHNNKKSFSIIDSNNKIILSGYIKYEEK